MSTIRLPPDKPTLACPGTLAKVDCLVARNKNGELLWHAMDAKMLSDNMARLQILSRSFMDGQGGRRSLGWQIVDEKEYRRRNHREEFWEEEPSPS